MSIVPQFLSFQTHHIRFNPQMCAITFVFSTPKNKLHHIRLPKKKLFFLPYSIWSNRPLQSSSKEKEERKKPQYIQDWPQHQTTHSHFSSLQKRNFLFLLLCFVLMRSRQNHPHDTIHRSKSTLVGHHQSVVFSLSLIFSSHRIIIQVYDKKARIKEKKLMHEHEDPFFMVIFLFMLTEKWKEKDTHTLTNPFLFCFNVTTWWWGFFCTYFCTIFSVIWWWSYFVTRKWTFSIILLFVDWVCSWERVWSSAIMLTKKRVFLCKIDQ